jgi:hypothetical protein
MGGIEELIGRRHAREAVAAVDQNSRAAREGLLEDRCRNFILRFVSMPETES